jgi:hypothetical protein
MLRNPFSVKVGNLLDEIIVLQQGRSVKPNGKGILVDGYGVSVPLVKGLRLLLFILIPSFSFFIRGTSTFSM